MWLRSPWLRQRILWMALAAFDLAAVCISYNLIYWTQRGAAPGLSGFVIALALLWVLSSYLVGRYSRRFRPSGTFVVLLVVTGAAAALQWGAQISDPRALPSFALPTALLTALFSLAAQWQAHQWQSIPKRWIVIGTGAELDVVRKEKHRGQDRTALQLQLIEQAAAAESLQTVNTTDLAGIAIGEQAQLNERALERLLALRRQGIHVIALVNWAEQVLQRVPPELFSNHWLAQAEGFELQPDRLGWRIKRLGDLLVAALLLVLSAPVMTLAAVLIKIEDGGPVVFSQIRTGIYGESFRLSKLRSMRTDAERHGARWASRGDPRITRVGYWLRRLRIDELPQLWNVIKGDMSLIGPRPERPEFEDELEAKIPHYRIRHWIRPGLSGWAQVCHPYGASVDDSRSKLSYDLYYLRNFSLPLDLLILLKTIRLVSRAAGSQPHA